MHIEDCLPLMTKRPLNRVVSSIVRENVPLGDEDRLREQIRQNAKELAEPARIARAMDFSKEERSDRILVEAILHALLESPKRALPDDELFEAVRAREAEILELSAQEGAFALTDDHNIEIYEVVLEVALHDNVISPDEFALLDRLRVKLGMSRLEHRLLEAKLGKYPKEGGALHDLNDYNSALRSLQNRGLLMYCKVEDGSLVVLPQEFTEPIQAAVCFEMRRQSQELLHDLLTNEQLRMVLKAQGMPLSGSKAERSERLLLAGVKPSEVLSGFSNEELADLCRRLHGVKVSGTKQERQARILDYFASIRPHAQEESADPRAVYYSHLEELAARDNQNLYAHGVIASDRDTDRGFEEGTRYLFEEKLGCKLHELPGSEHPDGVTAFPNGELLLWDNKSTSSDYVLPRTHMDQFRRYIQRAKPRATVFLIIVPSVATEARRQILKLRHETGTDTDIAIITAADLLWVAENWRDYTKANVFDLEVLNTTGVLSRVELEERMSVLLGRS